jgi:protoheme ferro-lyase
VGIVELAIIVTMGIMGGGMVALTLMAPRRNQNIFALLVLLALLLGLAGAVVSTLSTLTREPSGNWWPFLAENIANLALAAILGYAVTTYFVLNRPATRDPELPDRAASAAAAGDGPEKVAVLYFVPSEPADYDLGVVAPGLEIQDYRDGLPPALLRPFYLHTLREKYTRIGQSPARATHMRLAQKVQDRLARRARVYICFYNDQPSLAEAATMAIREGARRLIVLHARLTDPPPQVRVADLLAPIRPERYGVTVVETAPLWNSELLTRMLVRRAQAAVSADERAGAGLLLVGHGHPVPAHVGGNPGADAILRRQNQEMSFQKRVRQALIRGGFAEDKVVIGWWRWQAPSVASAQSQLSTERAAPLYWLGTGFPVDGLTTLHDIPRLLSAQLPAGVPPAQPLGAWGDDDVVAEALTEQVKDALHD